MFTDHELSILGMRPNVSDEIQPPLAAFRSAAFADYVAKEQVAVKMPQSDSDMLLRFETLGEAIELTDMLAQSGGLRPGQFRVQQGHGTTWEVIVEAGSIQSNPLLLARLRETWQGNVVESAPLDESAPVRPIGVKELAEMNPLHSYETGKFTNRSQIDNDGYGSWSKPHKTKMKFKKSKKGAAPVIQGKICGRHARAANGDVRCWDGTEKAPLTRTHDPKTGRKLDKEDLALIAHKRAFKTKYPNGFVKKDRSDKGVSRPFGGKKSAPKEEAVAVLDRLDALLA